MAKVVKETGVIKKISEILPQHSLITIYLLQGLISTMVLYFMIN